MAKAQRAAVLVATDGSEDAVGALNGVTIFPWPAGARVEVVVVRSAARLVDVPESVWAEVNRGYDQIAESARKILARTWPDAKATVVDGPIVPAILARARQIGARTIVAGSRGHGPIARLLLGSTSLGLVREMKHAALVVRGRPRQFTSVAMGLDASPHSRRAVAYLAGLDVPRGGHVTIVCVREPFVVPTLGLMPEAASAAVLTQADKENQGREKTLRRAAETAAEALREAGWKVDVKIRKGAPLPELLAGAKAAGAQLLVVGARGTRGIERLLLGSVCEGALHRAPVSVLVVR